MTCTGEGIPKPKATKIRKFAERYQIKKVARCKLCGSNNKNFEHMAYFELKRLWDFSLNKNILQYVGVCCGCIEEAGIKGGVQIDTRQLIVLNPS